jgi:hypothetical protein
MVGTLIQAMNTYTAMLYETPVVRMLLKDQGLGSIRRG